MRCIQLLGLALTFLSFVFELPNNDASLIPVASCLVVKASNDDALKGANGKPVIRPYTAISPPNAPGELALLIKQYDNGNMSKYIFSLKEGDTLGIKGPIVKFPYKGLLACPSWHAPSDRIAQQMNTTRLL